MNSTNRVLNRLILVVSGLVLVAAGAAAVALATAPAVAATWRQQAAALQRSAPVWVSRPVAGTASALTIGVAAAAVVVGLLLLLHLLRQGRGRTRRLLTRRTDGAATAVDLGVPRDLLDQHLATRPELITSRVSAYRVRRTPTLKVSVQARRGIAPTEAAGAVTDALRALDRVLGAELPAYVQVTGGFRTRRAKPDRVR